MKRRDFIAMLAGGAAALPMSIFAQQRMRRIGVLLASGPDDADFQAWLGAFLQRLALSGWIIGQNVRIDVHWATADAAEIHRHAAELAKAAPDVILAHGSSTVGPMLQATRTIPVVFPIISDPVGAGFVESLARPGGNATGFMSTEYSMGGKWLELLKEIAPSISRVAVLREATQGSGVSQFAAIQAVASSLTVQASPINMRDAAEIERALTEFARSRGGGLIVTAGPAATRYRKLIISLANRYKLPAVYYERFFVSGGGLASYGTDFIEHYRRAAEYVDRILNGEKPADLPVQAPTSYKLSINLTTAKLIGLTLSPTMLARADEVIE